MGRIVKVYDNSDELLANLQQKLEEAANNAIAGQNIFKIGLSGL